MRLPITFDCSLKLQCEQIQLSLFSRRQRPTPKMSSFYKPKFMKPDDDSVGWKQERPNLREGEFASAIYNPHSSVSIETQRQRLPIFKVRNHILYLLENHQTLVIVGETGCGKSTQIPQYLMEAGWTLDGTMVGITEPRRVAATSLATRVADEKCCLLGQDVGYSIRFDDCCDTTATKIKYMTEGILLREMMGDPLLKSYCVLMLDEVHERTLYTDIVLGLLKKILRKRKDLKLIVASATFEAEVLRDFFNKNQSNDKTKDSAVIMTIEGRTFPVDIYYLNDPTPNYKKECVNSVIKIHEKNEKGDVLVFLTGQEEVEDAVSSLIDYARSLRAREDLMKMFILPMYGALPASEQMKVFQPVAKNTRKVVVATNIAEASVTIHGIVNVIDSGFVKLRYYNPATSTDTLVVVPVSQASAEQRAGRAGRSMSGKSYRLYTEEDFHKLEKETPPEMLRSNMAPVILQLKAMGIDNVLRFDFPAAPPSKHVVDALELLYALGALDLQGNLTNPLGIQMAEFPLDPMYAKMLLVSGDFGCSEEAVAIVAMLQVQNIFFNPVGKGPQARKAKYEFSVSEGDHLTMLNVFLSFIKANKSRKWCDANFLNYKGLCRAVEIKSQLLNMLKKFKIKIVSCEGDTDAVCRCIVAGFFANSAKLHYSGVYKTVKGEHTLHIHPGSVLYTLKRQPEWVIFNEVLYTSREFMRDITVIEAKWLYELAPHYYQFGTEREIAEKEQSLG